MLTKEQFFRLLMAATPETLEKIETLMASGTDQKEKERKEKNGNINTKRN